MRAKFAATVLLLGAAATAGCAAVRPTARLAANDGGVRAAPAPSASPTSNPSGSSTPAPRSRDSDVPAQPVALPSCPGTGRSPHFTTPEAAMRYLAAAWNANNLDEVCHVSNPNARFLLNDMHREAVNLRLSHCKSAGVGAYVCYFDHDYPARMHRTGHGHAVFDVAAADTPGWYMTVFEGCG